MTADLNSLLPISPVMGTDLSLSPSLAINEAVHRLWAEGKRAYQLGFGESRFPVHPKLRAALEAQSGQMSYLAAQGLLPLRNEIAGFYGRHFGLDVKPEQIMVGPGSKPLLFALQLALDAELVLPTPCWVSYAPQAEMLGHRVRWVPGTPEEEYAVTIPALERTIRKSGAARHLLLLNTPNCPTGRMLPRAMLAELADFCRKHRIIVMSDEIYGLIPHGTVRHESIATYYPEGTIVLGGVSKHLSLGGWRLGVAIVPPTREGANLMAALVKIAGDLWSSPSAPIQHALIAAYRDDPEIVAYIAECARIHAIRTHALWECLHEVGVRVCRPDGGFYLFPNFDRWRERLAGRGVETSDELAAYLLQHHHIATMSGSRVGAPLGELSLRLATSYLDMENHEKAAAVLAAYRANPDPTVLLREYHPMLQEAMVEFRRFVKGL